MHKQMITVELIKSTDLYKSVIKRYRIDIVHLPKVFKMNYLNISQHKLLITFTFYNF
jgi:hypothetical protein